MLKITLKTTCQVLQELNTIVKYIKKSFHFKANSKVEKRWQLLMPNEHLSS